MKKRDDTPTTAAGEVLKEFEEAERDVDPDRAKKREHRGEAAEAVTPNEEAQESSQGEGPAREPTD